MSAIERGLGPDSTTRAEEDEARSYPSLRAAYPRNRYYYHHPSGLTGLYSGGLYHWYTWTTLSGYVKTGETRTREGAGRHLLNRGRRS